MPQKKLRKMIPLAEGTIIYLKGHQVIVRYEVERIDENGHCHLAQHGEVKKRFVYPAQSYALGEPLFRHGLRAYAPSSLLERDWEAFESRKKLMGLFKRLERIGRRIPNLQSSKKMLNCISIVDEFIGKMQEALKKQNK
jgi:hypothetical protein